jgi:hypothetical protein
MPNVGDTWLNTSNCSVAKLNAKSINILDSSEVAAYSTVAPGALVSVLSSGSGFEQDTVVVRNSAGSGYYYLSGEKHYHDSDTRKAGGLYSDIRRFNIAQALIFDGMHATVEKFARDNSGSGTTTNDLVTGASLLDSGITANGTASMRVTGVSMDYAKYSILQMKARYVGNATANFARFGVDMEPLSQTNQNTNPKYGIEGCAATSGNWYIVSANGDGVAGHRTQQDGAASLTPANPVSYKLQYIIGAAIRFTESTESFIDKTDFLPDITKTTSASNVVQLGVKTTDTNRKQLYVYGVALFGSVKDNGWV